MDVGRIPGPEGPGSDPSPIPDPGAEPGRPGALSVAGAARGLGIAPATLRSWERRYGLAPSVRTAGGHRRYSRADLARLQLMNRLVRDGVPPAEAAALALRTALSVADGEGHGVALAAPLTLAGLPVRPLLPPADDEPNASEAGRSARRASPGGGRVLPLGTQSAAVRGLARSAQALDGFACRAALTASLEQAGAEVTWESLIRPVLRAIGQRWGRTQRGVEIEHAFSGIASAVLGAHVCRLEHPRNARPALLASVPDELHDLPLVALQASLADLGVGAHLLGARTPEPALTDAVLALGSPVVVLFAQLPTDWQPALPRMRPAPTVLLGGPGWGPATGHRRVRDLAEALGAVRAGMGG